jgi:hypothetical protein
MRMGDMTATAAVTSDVPWYRQLLTDFSKALPGLATTYLSIQQQGELNKINLSRANQGLPAIDASDYQPGIQAGINRSTQNTIIIVAAGIAGALILSGVLGGGKRR